MSDNLDRPRTASQRLYQREKLRFYVDPTFSPFELTQLGAAVELVCDHLIAESIDHHPLYDCAVTRVTETLHPNWLLYQIGIWHDLFYGTPNGYYPPNHRRRGRLRGGIAYVQIVKLWDEPPDDEGRFPAGRAPIGSFLNGPSVIAISQEWINGEYSFNYPTLAEIASTIVHEMLHTFGLTHPDGAPGTFINEYGDCFPRLLDGGISSDFALVRCDCTGLQKESQKVRSEKLFFVNLQKGQAVIFNDDKVEDHFLSISDFGCNLDDPDEPTYELHLVYMKELDQPTKQMIKDWRALPYVCYVEQNDEGDKQVPLPGTCTG